MGWFLLCLPHCGVGGAFRPASLYFRQIVRELLLHSLPESGSLPRPFLNVNSRRRLPRPTTGAGAAAEAIFLRVEPSLDINKGGPRKGERNCTVRRTRPLEQQLHPSGGLSLSPTRAHQVKSLSPRRGSILLSASSVSSSQMEKAPEEMVCLLAQSLTLY